MEQAAWSCYASSATWLSGQQNEHYGTHQSEAAEGSRIPAAGMLAFMTEAFLACGLTDADAATVARAMIEADLTGSDAHGIFRLAQYVRCAARRPRQSAPELEADPGRAGNRAWSTATTAWATW